MENFAPLLLAYIYIFKFKAKKFLFPLYEGRMYARFNFTYLTLFFIFNMIPFFCKS